MPHCPAENERIHELVRMRCGDKDDRSILGYAIGSARVDFAEEEVDNDAEDPKAEVVDQIIDPGASASHVELREGVFRYGIVAGITCNSSGDCCRQKSWLLCDMDAPLQRLPVILNQTVLSHNGRAE